MIDINFDTVIVWDSKEDRQLCVIEAVDIAVARDFSSQTNEGRITVGELVQNTPGQYRFSVRYYAGTVWSEPIAGSVAVVSGAPTNLRFEANVAPVEAGHTPNWALSGEEPDGDDD